ncbi:MAG: aminotransferase class I/II-fold pyridoxal phosphate-dependent enzyme [Anaerolineales bacterium]|nr:aminotransferase class I/II-fold pyridoxal phosphate-dependent enzyme [Anaerolineales bacterium]
MKEEQKSNKRNRGVDTRFIDTALGTRCVHAGETLGPIDSIPIATPLYSAASYTYPKCQDFEDLLEGRRSGYAYARWGTPTNSALETALSTLIGGGKTITTASGMAANFVALQAAGAGQGKNVLLSRDVYGNTYDIIKNAFESFGATAIFADFSNLDHLQKLITSTHPDIVFFEVLTNPLLVVVDAPEVIRMAHAAGARVIVDNTFATPYLYQPFLDGADYVTHSLTKYLNGHGDTMGGSITCRTEDFNQLEYTVCTQGATLSPENARLVLRGLKTLHLRMARHCENAIHMAAFLNQHKRVSRVRFPGLTSHPAHETALRLFKPGKFGGMISFDLLPETKAASFAFIDSLKLAVAAGSLGDVGTLVIHPSSTTHHSLSAEEKKAIGINDGTIRISVGVEEIEDLLADFEQAFKSRS